MEMLIPSEYFEIGHEILFFDFWGSLLVKIPTKSSSLQDKFHKQKEGEGYLVSF